MFRTTALYRGEFGAMAAPPTKSELRATTPSVHDANETFVMG